MQSLRRIIRAPRTSAVIHRRFLGALRTVASFNHDQQGMTSEGLTVRFAHDFYRWTKIATLFD